MAISFNRIRFFEAVHPAFPLLDETAVRNAYRSKSLPYTLICEIYAVTLLSWDTSPEIAASGRTPPDLRYIWNVTVSAMHKNFQAPSMSTVLACILDILGRPITSITYNAINVGSCVALAQSLGLNRDPGGWQLNPKQKRLRIKTWWTLFIHDMWYAPEAMLPNSNSQHQSDSLSYRSSLCHGTPSHIHRGQWDVQLPELSTVLDDLDGRNPLPESRIKGARSFICLCRLTQLLEEALEIIYSLQPTPVEGTLDSLTRIDEEVSTLQESLPPELNPSSKNFERLQPGSLNLQLSFLAVKMCLSRAALQTIRVANSYEPHYHQSRCIKACNEFMDAVISISVKETKVFWLPCKYTNRIMHKWPSPCSHQQDIAYHFASAATLMMRCAIEAQDDAVSIDCVGNARRFMDHLKRMKTLANWDLADICLNQCETTVQNMSASDNLRAWRQKRAHLQRNTARTNVSQDPPEGLDVPSEIAASFGQGSFTAGSFLDDLQEQMAGDFYFPDLWHTSHF